MNQPHSWNWIFEDFVPNWVKKQYPPSKGKDRPFNKFDVNFYSRGVLELSDMFTEDRPKKLPAYFQHPKFRSSYLLYFLQFQAAKFLTLFRSHPDAMDAALKHAEKVGKIRILDYGSGPGTASLALVIWLQNHAHEKKFVLPPIEFEWVDMQYKMMDEGRKLISAICDHYPQLRGKVTISISERDLGREPYSLILMGNVLNEMPNFSSEKAFIFWEKIFKRSQGGGILIVEPAIKKASQSLSFFRDVLIEKKWVTSIWGPCLHVGRCPLTLGRDWCHFSFPIRIPGSIFQEFSKTLGSIRNWLKFSYLWMASEEFPATKPAADQRRVVSDPIMSSGRKTVLLCEPNQVYRYGIQNQQSGEIFRGSLISMSVKDSRPPFERPRHTGRPKSFKPRRNS
jgi:ribosomal protein RSM22 (predicted rRNA methylase)